MKVVLKYTVLLMMLVCLASSHILANKKTTSWKKTYSRNDKIPYGTYVTYQALQHMFDKVEIKDSKKIFKHNESYLDEPKVTNQLKFIIAQTFEWNDVELDKLLTYIEQGNYVFLSAENISENLLNKFHVSQYSGSVDDSMIFTTNQQYVKLIQTFYLGIRKDTVAYSLKKAIPATSVFHNYNNDNEPSTDEVSANNKNYENTMLDKSIFDKTVLGTSANGDPNFLMIRYGKGKLFLHSAPLLFTNYFLLQADNKTYLAKAISHIPKNVELINWHQYMYRHFEQKKPASNNPLSGLMKYPMWMAAIALACLGLVLFILFNGKRRQREVPIIPPITNTSLEFVETIGQLYYNKQDHKNLAEKMILHLLEKIRTHFNIFTNKLDEEFIETLTKKSGAPASEVNELMNKIVTIRNMHAISASQLISLYKHIQHFNQYLL